MSLIEPLPIKIFRLAQTHWRKVAIGIFFLLFAIFAVVTFRSCGKKEVKIDLETVDKINSANEIERKAELREWVEDHTEVVQTVGNRSTIADTHVAERNKEVDAKVADANAKIAAAKQAGRDVTASELECMMTGICE